MACHYLSQSLHLTKLLCGPCKRCGVKGDPGNALGGKKESQTGKHQTKKRNPTAFLLLCRNLLCNKWLNSVKYKQLLRFWSLKQKPTECVEETKCWHQAISEGLVVHWFETTHALTA